MCNECVKTVIQKSAEPLKVKLEWNSRGMNREITYSGSNINEVATVLKEADEVIKSMFKDSMKRNGED